VNRIQSKSLVRVLCLLSAGATASGTTDAVRASVAMGQPASTSVARVMAGDVDQVSAAFSAIQSGELKAGLVYLAVEGTGIVVLDGGTIRTIQPLGYSVKRMVYGSDGAIWVTAIDGIFRIAGATSRQLARQDVDALAVIGQHRGEGLEGRGRRRQGPAVARHG
jgi:hypothetical protein